MLTKFQPELSSLRSRTGGVKWGRERWCDREWEVWSGGNGGYDLGRVRAADESVNVYVCVLLEIWAGGH